MGGRKQIVLEAEEKKTLKKHEPEKDSMLETQLIGIHERARWKAAEKFRIELRNWKQKLLTRWCKKIKFLLIGTWCHLLSKWKEMKHIRFTGLMEEGSWEAQWLRFFPALILGVSGTNRISCSPTHPAVYKSQVRVKSQSDFFFFFPTWLILWSTSPDGYGNGYAITNEGGHRGRQDKMMEEDHGKRELFKTTQQTKVVHNTVV